MTDQVALVTGGAGGFGSAVARRLHERAAAVVVADIDPAGEAVADEIDGLFVLDGVVFGVVAALPALLARGAGQIVATASLAGLVAVPNDPLYVANKHAVVGLVRSLGLAYGGQGLRINALCPGFADTPLIAGAHDLLREAGFPIIPVADVVTAFEAIIDGDGTGECWFVQAGRRSEPFAFRRVPGPRVDQPS